jgi:hypothetical protein
MGCVFRDLTGQLSMQGMVRQSNLKSQSPEELQLGRLTRENQITATTGYVPLCTLSEVGSHRKWGVWGFQEMCSPILLKYILGGNGPVGDGT